MKIVGVLLGLGSTATVIACCGVGAGGALVKFIGQSNIVVWDQKTGTEHFIRDATFKTAAKDLGFIAPTPSKPTLSEADVAAFDTLAARKPRLFDTKGEEMVAASAEAAGAVTVVGEQDVAGYHATILKATDAAGLSQWLKNNGYGVPRFMNAWAKSYIDRNWFFTAFKVKGGDAASTGPVRMTFKTDRPFNPYFVPRENASADGASLRLFYVSAGQEVPKIGGSVAWQAASWNAPLPEPKARLLARQLHLPADGIPANATVTSYEDHRFGQSGSDDLYFIPVENVSYRIFAAGAAVLFLGYMATRGRRKVLVAP